MDSRLPLQTTQQNNPFAAPASVHAGAAVTEEAGTVPTHAPAPFFVRALAPPKASSLVPLQAWLATAKRAKPTNLASLDWQHEYFHRGEWRRFRPMQNTKLNICQRESKWSSARWTMGGEVYVVDFIRMVQVRVSNQKQRAIRWTDPITGKIVRPPVEFSHPQFASPVLAPYAVPNIQGLLQPVFETEPDYQRLKAVCEAVDTRAGVRNVVVAVHRIPPGSDACDGFWAWREAIYNATKAHVQVSRGGEAYEVEAWHGSSSEGLTGILSNGFTIGAMTNGAVLGHGVYFAPFALPEIASLYSDPDDSGLRHALLCNVILGRTEKAHAAMTTRSSADYDNAVDDPVAPQRYVVWPTNMATHVLPRYLVSFKQHSLSFDSPIKALPATVPATGDTLGLGTNKPSSILQGWIEGDCDGAPGPALSSLIGWCCQRLPKPLVEYWCDTTEPRTIDDLHRLRAAIGEEDYGTVVRYMEAHLEHGKSTALDAVQQFNVAFDNFVVRADKIKEKGDQATSEERAEAETFRVTANALVPKMNQQYQQQLRRMTDLRIQMRKARELPPAPFVVTQVLKQLYLSARHVIHCKPNSQGACGMGESACAAAASRVEHVKTCTGHCEFEAVDPGQCARLREFVDHYVQCIKAVDRHEACESCRALFQVCRVSSAEGTACKDLTSLQDMSSPEFAWDACSSEVKAVVQAVLPQVQILARKRGSSEGVRNFLARLMEEDRAVRRRLCGAGKASSEAESDEVRFAVCRGTRALVAYLPKDTVGVSTGVTVEEELGAWANSTGIIARDAKRFQRAWRGLAATAQESLLDRALTATDLNAAVGEATVRDAPSSTK